MVSRSWTRAFLLFAATIAVHAPSISNGFTNWDDPLYVLGNPFAARGLAGIPAAFAVPLDDVWYPLTHAAVCLIQAVAGLSPFAHHLVQVVLAGVAVACIPEALATFGMRRSPGAVAALVWMIHPMRVESFAWASSLKDVLSLLGVVLALAAWGRGRRWIASACFAAALLAKSTVFPVAFLFVWLEWGRAGALRRTAGVWLPALACTLVAMDLHVLGEGPAARIHPGGDLLAAIPTALYLPWWYVGRALAFAHPQAVYAFAPVGWAELRFGAALALWALAALAAWRLPVGDRRTRIGALLAFAIPFAPVTGLVPLAFPVADRFALLPSLAFTAAAAALLAAWSARLGSRQRVAAGGVALVLVAAASLPVGLARQAEWRDAITLWEADRARAPEVPVVRINLAAAYGAASRWGDAIDELQAMHRRGIPYEHRARDLFFALAAQDGMEPELVVRLSRAIEGAKGSDAVVRLALAAARVAGHPAVAERFEALQAEPPEEVAARQ